MKGYLDPPAVAVRAGVKTATIHRYNSTGGMPEPDDHVGRTPVWKEATIDDWLRNRPGHGWRKGKADPKNKPSTTEEPPQ